MIPRSYFIVHFLKKTLRLLLLAPVVVILVFEEWGWEPLARAFAALGRLPWWGALERLITRLPPWAALLAFGLPAVALIPLKLLALSLFGRGHFALGLFMVLTAKVAGTAAGARLFQLTHPALMRMRWFSRLYTAWKRWKDALLGRVRATGLWQLAGQLKRRIAPLGRAGWRRLESIFTARTR